MALIEVAAGFVSLSVAMAPVLITWIRERAFTNRLDCTLKDSTPEQRAELLRAWGEAEKQVDGKPRPEVAGPAAPKADREPENA